MDNYQWKVCNLQHVSQTKKIRNYPLFVINYPFRMTPPK